MSVLQINNLDLNIQNYNFDDILKLFNLSINYNENDLKEVKKLVLFMHPDKSGLDKNFFLFYSSAFKLLHTLYFSTLKNLSNEKIQNQTYNYKNVEIINDDTKELLNKIKKEKNENFNKWFNEEFEKLNCNFDDENEGYGSWLKQNIDLPKQEKINNINDLHKNIEKRKKEVQNIVKYNGINEYCNSSICCSRLIDNKSSYESDIFSGNFKYDDIKKAYTESVIPVENNNNNILNKSYEELLNARNSEILKPISNEEGIKQISENNNKLNNEYIKQSYDLLKKQEEMNKKNQNFLSKLILIKEKQF